MLTPKRIKIQLRRSASVYYENSNKYKTLKILKFKKADLIPRNLSCSNTLNSSPKKIDLNNSLKLTSNNSKLRIFDSFQHPSYGTINNAQISKINLSLIKYDITAEQNILFSNNTKFKKKYNYSPLNINKIKRRMGNRIWSNSVKNTNNSNGSFFDSTQISRESYAEKRKIYVLKNTRNYFTRNKNLVLSKIVKKMEDKMV